MSEAVDAVVTWVDGEDPVHAAKLAAFLPPGAPRPRVAAPTRYRSVGEVAFCVASLLTHAPWLRRVHIITDAQRPAFLDDPRWPADLRARVSVVDHRTVFAGFEDLLPTFNSRAIETMMWRIPGLADRFVYLNDDFLLIRPAAIEDFFDAGRPVLRGRWKTPPERELGRRLRATVRGWLGRPKPPTLTHQRGQIVAAAMVGFGDRFYAMDHLPHPLRRATFERWFDAHPQTLRANAAHRFRSVEQFGICALAHHLEIRAGTAVLTDAERLFYCEPHRLDDTQVQAVLDAASADAHLLFACVQSLDEATDSVRARVLDWLAQASGAAAFASRT